MKILIYGMNYAPEPVGIGKYTSEMAEWFVSRGHDCRVIASYPYYPEWRGYPGYRGKGYRKENLRRVQVFRCPVWVPKKLSGITRAFHLLSFAITGFPVLLYQVFRKKPDIVLTIAPNFLCSLGGWLAARLCGARAVLHMQDLEIDIAFKMKLIPQTWFWGWLGCLERGLLRRFDSVSAVSEAMIRRLESKGVPSSLCCFFPNWVDSREIFPMIRPSCFREKWGIEPDTQVALYSGSMGAKQGLETLVETARFMSTYPHVKFILCGNGPRRCALEEKAKDLHNILFCDLQPLEDFNELLNLADVHLLPQGQDVADFLMPSKLTGMFASGRPVVATVKKGTFLAAIIQEGGVTVAPGDVAAFAAALLAFFETPEEREKLGEKARTYGVQHWDKEKVLSGFEQRLLSLIGG